MVAWYPEPGVFVGGWFLLLMCWGVLVGADRRRTVHLLEGGLLGLGIAVALTGTLLPIHFNHHAYTEMDLLFGTGLRPGTTQDVPTPLRVFYGYGAYAIYRWFLATIGETVGWLRVFQGVLLGVGAIAARRTIERVSGSLPWSVVGSVLLAVHPWMVRNARSETVLLAGFAALWIAMDSLTALLGDDAGRLDDVRNASRWRRTVTACAALAFPLALWLLAQSHVPTMSFLAILALAFVLVRRRIHAAYLVVAGALVGITVLPHFFVNLNRLSRTRGHVFDNVLRYFRPNGPDGLFWLPDAHSSLLIGSVIVGMFLLLVLRPRMCVLITATYSCTGVFFLIRLSLTDVIRYQALPASLLIAGGCMGLGAASRWLPSERSRWGIAGGGGLLLVASMLPSYPALLTPDLLAQEYLFLREVAAKLPATGHIRLLRPHNDERKLNMTMPRFLFVAEQRTFKLEKRRPGDPPPRLPAPGETLLWYPGLAYEWRRCVRFREIEVQTPGPPAGYTARLIAETVLTEPTGAVYEWIDEHRDRFCAEPLRLAVWELTPAPTARPEPPPPSAPHSSPGPARPTP